MKAIICDGEPHLRELLQLSVEFHAEAPEAFLPFDLDKTAMSLLGSMTAGLAIGAEAPNGLCGMLPLARFAPAYSTHEALFDLGLYVRPSARKSRAAFLMIDAAIAIAGSEGLPLFIAPSTGVDVDRKNSFFERAGFKRMGSIFRWGG